MDLTKSELELMNILWNAGRPLARNEIISLSKRKAWKGSSIHMLLNGLLEKEAIKEAGFVRSGKVWGRLYASNLSCEEYYAENIFAGSSREVLPLLFSALLRNEEVTPDLIDELEEMLAKRRLEQEQKEQ